MTWLRRLWRWAVLALAVVLPVAGWWAERRARLAAEDRTRRVLESHQRERELAATLSEIERQRVADRERVLIAAEAAAASAEGRAAEIRAIDTEDPQALEELAEELRGLAWRRRL